MKLPARGLLLIAALLLIPACAPLTAGQLAGEDQEIARDILWSYQQDAGGRFNGVRVTCVDRAVTLEGRVGDLASAQEAFRLARSRCRGAALVSRINVQPK